MKRGLASPCVHSALATTRRSRDQLSSVDHGNSLKRRAGFPLASDALLAAASSLSIIAARRALRAKPKR